MTVATSQLETYISEFPKFLQVTSAGLRELRENAFAEFCRGGFPTIHDEDWRFTSLAALARIPFHLARRRSSSIAISDLAMWRIEGAAARMVFVDGHFAPDLSEFTGLSQVLDVSSLHHEIVSHGDNVAAHLGGYLDIKRDPFCALNTAFAEDGAYIHVHRGAAVKQPIHLLFVSTPQDAPVMTHPRNLILVDEGGQALIVEDYVSIAEGAPALSNAATELIAGPNSTVEHTLIEREHLATFNFSTLRIEQSRNANVHSHSFLLGGALVRNNVHPRLAGEGGECLINGLYLGGGQQHLDNYMLVEHASPHCASRQFYNGILDDRAHGVFHGRIVVHKDAQKTDAKQTNRNLLLSDDAQIDTKPQLEIHADDVRCTHGATIGQIEEGALFYLRSRGLTEAEARQLLLQAFAGECLDRMMSGAARAYAAVAVRQSLPRFLHSTGRKISTSNTSNGDWARHWGELG
jgi:Fe-S cluster assembly protein SufD